MGVTVRRSVRRRGWCRIRVRVRIRVRMRGLSRVVRQ